MDKLVVDHTYGLGMAWDKTSNRNHGILHLARPGTGTFKGAMSFSPGRSHPGSAIIIPAARSLQDLGTLRVRCRVYPSFQVPIDPGFNPGAAGPRRQNIVEAHGSFALYLSGKFELIGTILAPDNRWVGIIAAKGAVPFNRWSLLEFWYDGISTAELLVNGQRVASTYDPGQIVTAPMRGPVRSVGPNGIFVGHWPHPDDGYTFHGYIRDVQVWKRDDKKQSDEMRNPCCKDDLKSLYRVADKLRKQGYDARFWRKRKQQLLALGADVAATLRGNDEQGTMGYNRHVQEFMDALTQGDGTQFETKMRAVLEHLKDRVDRPLVESVKTKVEALLSELPFSRDDLLKIGKALCVKDIERPARKIADDIKNDPSWEAARKKFQ